MEERLDYAKGSPGGYKALLSLETYIEHCALEPLLKELVKFRASQLNGCAYCLDMHSKDARALGESEHRLYAVSAWREAPFYSDRERAALLWTEEVTLVGSSHVSDEAYEEVSRHFSETELADLTMAIVLINGWNRLCVAFRSVPGAYMSKKKPLAVV